MRRGGRVGTVSSQRRVCKAVEKGLEGGRGERRLGVGVGWRLKPRRLG